jgi:hypothetical protein
LSYLGRPSGFLHESLLARLILSFESFLGSKVILSGCTSGYFTYCDSFTWGSFSSTFGSLGYASLTFASSLGSLSFLLLSPELDDEEEELYELLLFFLLRSLLRDRRLLCRFDAFLLYEEDEDE